MREYKFRGKRIDNGEWVYGDLWQYQGSTWIVTVIEGEAQRYTVDPETVGQYTGLKDRNGKEIYEMDIVSLTVPDEEYVIQGNGYLDVGIEKGWDTQGEVRFLYNCWFIDRGDGKGCPLDFEGEKALKVIGNRWDNPDLLEGGYE